MSPACQTSSAWAAWRQIASSIYPCVSESKNIRLIPAIDYMYLCKSKYRCALRYFVEFAYNGMAFHGWQIQPNSITVQQTLNEALTTVLRQEVYAVGAGRTDTGVHARQMFAHFDTSEAIDDPERLTRSLNGILYPNVAVNQVFRVREDAHARFSAIEREYQYDIHYKHNPFLYQRSLLWLWQPLDVDALNRVSQLLLGEKDFSCFEKTGGNNKHSYCHVRLAEWTETEVGIRFTIRANRFLRNMVRAIVGTLLDYGAGKITEDEFASILVSGDRRQAGASVPPYALYLTKVCYPETIFIAHE